MYICREKPPEEWEQQYLLRCVHSFNSKSKMEYLMYCNVLKVMPDKRVKIKVFGNRATSMNGSRIRYVHFSRLQNGLILNSFSLEWRNQ